MTIAAKIATELQVRTQQVEATILLLNDGATVPFIARYRKEVTGALDDTQLRTLEARLVYLRDLELRRQSILTTIKEQGKLDQQLQQRINAAETLARLEDLYLPYKPKRRTRAQIAKEAGLEPLAMQLLNGMDNDPEVTAVNFIDKDNGIDDVEAALDGARQILIELFAEDAEVTGRLRSQLEHEAWVSSRLLDDDKRTEGARFSDYFDYHERWADIPSHRALAMFRGRKEGVLALNLIESASQLDDAKADSRGIATLAVHFSISDQGRAADSWLQGCIRWAWKTRLLPRLELGLFNELRQRAEEEAIQVFANNLRDVLLAAPAGTYTTLGMDPGLRTGVKLAVVDGTGKLLDTATIFPHVPQRRHKESLNSLLALVQRHKIELIAIGNGTGSRETEALIQEFKQMQPELNLISLIVSEAGASIYSASALAAAEFPNLDVTLRGAVSIARRLQDPLAELVKIEAKSIGVGQYQHDVNQVGLARKLDGVVEDCVNHVGVDVNTASVPLLAHVAGISPRMADNIVQQRDSQGPFKTRKQLLKVAGIGPKSFQQAAGFLRIRQGDETLDASAVHPEAYPLVSSIAATLHCSIDEIMQNPAILKSLKPESVVDENFGLPTVRDVLSELAKPGRDPRPEFKTAHFRQDVSTVSDLTPNMVLEGVVSNVANFGAFVDIGVHQDGLVHISALSHRFVDDPRKVVKAGDVVQVKVISIDVVRKRIALSMRLDDEAESSTQKKQPQASRKTNEKPAPTRNANKPASAMAAAFSKAGNRKR